MKLRILRRKTNVDDNGNPIYSDVLQQYLPTTLLKNWSSESGLPKPRPYEWQDVPIVEE